MRKAVNRFILSAMLAIFVLLTLFLGVINGMNFTLVASDADRVTEMIAGSNGDFRPNGSGMGHGPEGFDHRGLGGMRFMGPDSPELAATTRFFTVVFDKDGQGRLAAYAISAVTEEEAVEWASTLTGETTGWTKTSYRYRVTERDGQTWVTVIDQSRELLPSYRILIASVAGEILGLALSFLFLRLTARRLFRPIEEADRKERRFIADAEAELKVPLTVVSANMELIERASGPTEQTRAVRRQVRRMTDLVRRLGRLAILEEEKAGSADLSRALREAVEAAAPRFEEAGLTLEAEIAPDIAVPAAQAACLSLAEEILENARKYGKTHAKVTLRRESERVILTAENDCELPDGEYEEAFDRFTTLANGQDGTGLGLAHVKEIVRGEDGRLSARVKDGVFTLRIDW